MSDATADSPLTHDTTASRPAVIPASRVIIALIRREFWEHRALWIVPLVTSALLLGTAALTTHAGPTGSDRTFFGPLDWYADKASGPDPHAVAVAISSLWQCLIAVPFYLAAGVMVFFYLLSSLYDERRDRSILFWKSLPVSDTATVVAKLLVALVVVPLGVYAVWTVTHLLYAGAWELRHALGLIRGPRFVWDTVAWLKVEMLMLTAVVLSSLWYAPVAGYLMLISAWARRNPFLWAVLPPVILAAIERIALGTSYLNHMLLGRLAGVWTSLQWNGASGDAFNGAVLDTPRGRLISLPEVFDMIDLRSLVFANTDLWIGLAFAAAFICAAIRVRRYRDDT